MTACSSSSTRSWIARAASSSAAQPAGQEYDGQVVNAGEGRLGRSTTTSSGSGAGFNGNWDGAWDVRTSVSDVGWSAEFAIPFRTLSYPDRDVQTWGMNVQRNIRRRNEIVYWAPLPRQVQPAPAVDGRAIVGHPAGAGGARPQDRALRGRRSDPLRRKPPHDGAGRCRCRSEVQRDARPHARPDLQHGLRAGGGGRSADQPGPVQSLLSGETALLSRERRRLLGEQRPPGGRRRPGPDRAVSSAAASGSVRTDGRSRSSGAPGCRARSPMRCRSASSTCRRRRRAA